MGGMFSQFFHAVFYDPLYNGLVALIDVVPGGDVGVAVILLTLVVKAALLPLSLKASRTQLAMKRLEPELARVKATVADKAEQARRTMELYRANGVNPLSSLLTILIQIPIVIALYLVFFKGGLPDVNLDLLYGFVPVPEEISMRFLGFLDVGGRSLALALLAGATQFLHARFALPSPLPRTGTPSFKDDLARSFHIQMKYVLPVVVAAVAYTLSAAVALYWVTSNLAALSQEAYVRRTIPRA